MVGFWAIVMRPARNQQKKVQQLQQRARGRPGGRPLRGDLRHHSLVDRLAGRDRGGPGHRDHGGAPGRRTTRRRARRPSAGTPAHRRDGADRPDRSHQDRGLRRTDTVAKKTPRPGRTLLIFGLTIARPLRAGRPRPDLEAAPRARPRGRHPDHAVGDHQGGASHPDQAQAGRRASSTQRVNGSGVSEAEVSTQGNRNIIVEIPGENASNLVDAVKRTAQLRFRIVAGQPQPGTPAASRASSPPSPSARPALRQGQADADRRRRRRPTRRPRTRGRRRSPSPTPTPTPRRRSPRPRRPQAAAADRQGRVRRRPAGLVAEPRRRVAAEVRRVHLPGEGRRRRPDRRRRRRAADRLQRRRPEVPAVQVADRGHRAEVGVLRHPAERRRLGGQPRLQELGPRGLRRHHDRAEPATAAPSRSCSTAR